HRSRPRRAAGGGRDLLRGRRRRAAPRGLPQRAGLRDGHAPPALRARRGAPRRGAPGGARVGRARRRRAARAGGRGQGRHAHGADRRAAARRRLARAVRGGRLSMDPRRFEQISETEWRLPPQGAMRVPAVLYASETLVRDMDDKVLEQMSHVATLSGIVRASYAMPDAHWGYGFPIGGVAAFDAEQGGVVSAGGVGFDISCGVRMLHTGLRREAAEALFRAVPAGVGSTGALHLGAREMEAMLAEGARWAVSRGHGEPSDLDRI